VVGGRGDYHLHRAEAVSVTAGHGTFRLTRKSRILAKSGAARTIAEDLAADLAPATGYRLKVGSGSARVGDVQLAIGDPGTLANDTHMRAITLMWVRTSSPWWAPTSVVYSAGSRRSSAPGLDHQLHCAARLMDDAAVSITDYPRYSYRGVMVDIARHYAAVRS